MSATSTHTHLSPIAANELIDAIDSGLTMFDDAADSLSCATDCPHGCCNIEPDAFCRHGYLAAQETMFGMVA